MYLKELDEQRWFNQIMKLGLIVDIATYVSTRTLSPEDKFCPINNYGTSVRGIIVWHPRAWGFNTQLWYLWGCSLTSHPIALNPVGLSRKMRAILSHIAIRESLGTWYPRGTCSSTGMTHSHNLSCNMLGIMSSGVLQFCPWAIP